MWSRAGRAVGIEVRCARVWRKKDGNALADLVRGGVVRRAFAIYLGPKPLVDRSIRVLPLGTFLRLLQEGGIIET
jgi:hypothetical protein